MSLTLALRATSWNGRFWSHFSGNTRPHRTPKGQGAAVLPCAWKERARRMWQTAPLLTLWGLSPGSSLHVTATEKKKTPNTGDL